MYSTEPTSYDRDNLVIAGGLYTWSDCLRPDSHGYVQVSRLHLASLPDDGDHDTVTIVHRRAFASPVEADAIGRTEWGSVLSRDVWA